NEDTPHRHPRRVEPPACRRRLANRDGIDAAREDEVFDLARVVPHLGERRRGDVQAHQPPPGFGAQLLVGEAREEEGARGLVAAAEETVEAVSVDGPPAPPARLRVDGREELFAEAHRDGPEATPSDRLTKVVEEILERLSRGSYAILSFQIELLHR